MGCQFKGKIIHRPFIGIQVEVDGSGRRYHEDCSDLLSGMGLEIIEGEDKQEEDNDEIVLTIEIVQKDQRDPGKEHKRGIEHCGMVAKGGSIMESQGKDEGQGEGGSVDEIEVLIEAPEGGVHELDPCKDEAHGIELHLLPFHEDLPGKKKDSRSQEHEGDLTPDRNNVGWIVPENGKGDADDHHPQDLKVA